MAKANFVRKFYGTGFERDFVFLDYEYRGRVYTVYENRAKGNEPLAWQHRNAQREIDRQIEIENMPKKPHTYEDTVEYGLKLFFDYVENGTD